MRTFGKWLGRVLLVLVVAVAGVWQFGAAEPVKVDVRFDPARLGGDVDAYLARTEGVFDDLREGAAKRVVWAAGGPRKTKLAVVYLHGFSAGPEEIRPVPDQVARALGANLYYTRFAGHGRDGDALAGARVEDWMYDASEAMAIGRELGEEVIVMSTSTGGTIAALIAQDAAMRAGVKGMVFVAPNFGINNPAAPLLTWPAARTWVPLLVGAERSFEPRNEMQGRHWTTRYPTVAVLPLAAIVKHAVALDYSRVDIPALFYFSDADQVVRPEVTHRIVDQWGGPVTKVMAEPGEGVDSFMHVISGDIVSPANTAPTVAMILGWIAGL